MIESRNLAHPPPLAVTIKGNLGRADGKDSDGQDGKDGDGQDGKDDLNGKDGHDGKDGLNGKDGHDGHHNDLLTLGCTWQYNQCGLTSNARFCHYCHQNNHHHHHHKLIY